MSALAKLKRHKRVESVSVEGELVFVYLKDGWARYGTGRQDGASKGFELEDYTDMYAENDKDFDPEAHYKAALKWVEDEVFPA